MSERKNVKRNANRPRAKDRGLVQSMQRNYKKLQEETGQTSLLANPKIEK